MPILIYPVGVALGYALGKLAHKLLQRLERK